MEFLGYIRPDGSVGIRNYICLLSADECSDPVCERVAATIKGAVAMPYQKVLGAGEMEEEALKSLMVGNATNPNVGAIIIIESKSENLLARHIANEAAKTGRLIEVVNTVQCRGVVGASARALSTAITMARDITTYRREPVKISKLNTGIWLEENSPYNLSLALEKCCRHLAEHESKIIGNTGVYNALGSGGEEQGPSGFNKRLSNAERPGFKLFSTKSRKQFEALAVAAGAQISVITVKEGLVLDHPLVPTIRITSDRGYYEKMTDTVEMDLSSICGCDPDPDGAGLLVLNEILATCSGRLSKWEIINGISF